jgi:hypothetical protein
MMIMLTLVSLLGHVVSENTPTFWAMADDTSHCGISSDGRCITHGGGGGACTAQANINDYITATEFNLQQGDVATIDGIEYTETHGPVNVSITTGTTVTFTTSPQNSGSSFTICVVDYERGSPPAYRQRRALTTAPWLSGDPNNCSGVLDTPTGTVCSTNGKVCYRSMTYPASVAPGETFTFQGEATGNCNDACSGCLKRQLVGFPADEDCPGSNGGACCSRSGQQLERHTIGCHVGSDCTYNTFSVTFTAPTVPGCYPISSTQGHVYCSSTYQCTGDVYTILTYIAVRHGPPQPPTPPAPPMPPPVPPLVPMPQPVFEAIAEMSLNGTNCLWAAEGAAADLPLGLSPYTIEAWIQPSPIVNGGGIIGWGTYGSSRSTNAIRIDNAGNTVRNYWWSADFTSKGSTAVDGEWGIMDGKWHHVGAAWDGSKREVMLDGTKVTKIDTTGPNSLTDKSTFCIGRAKDNEYFTGNIRGVRVWNQYVDLLSYVDVPTALISANAPSPPPPQSDTTLKLMGAAPKIVFGTAGAPVCELSLDPISSQLDSTCAISDGSRRRRLGSEENEAFRLELNELKDKVAKLEDLKNKVTDLELGELRMRRMIDELRSAFNELSRAT